jgi:glucose/arabinose dehydrogenase
MRYLFLALLIFTSSPALAESYPANDSMCDGYPQAKGGTKEGTCLGIVLQADDEVNWRKPRRIVQVPNTQQYIITDMGGWTRGRGTVWLLDASSSPATLSPLMTELKLPHGLEIGPKGLFYVGETDRIFRFRLDQNKAVDIETVVKDLPDFKKHSHPLTHFIFDQHNNLIVNVGAPSDQCQEDKREVYCSSVNNTPKTHAAIRRYPYLAEVNLWSIEYKVIASGLRNSMALSSHASGTLLQAENSIDLPGLHQPFEELNLIEEGGFYGWPYCYDNKKVNRLWPTHGRRICHNPEKHKQPWILLPPHAAPLDMRYYDGDMFPSLKGNLLISWHGYRQTGHRLVAYATDEKGLPVRDAKAHYKVDPDKDAEDPAFTIKSFPELKNIAQGDEIVGQLNAVPNVRPRGRPVGITVSNDGAILILDDVNKALLRLAKGEAYKPKEDDTTIDETDLLTAVNNTEAAQVLLTRCQACHGLTNNIEEMKIPNTWLRLQDGKRVIEQRLFHSPLRRMPPGAPLTSSQQATLKAWLNPNQ